MIGVRVFKERQTMKRNAGIPTHAERLTGREGRS